MSADKQGGMAICTFNEPDTACEDIVVTDNIAAGCIFAGFVTQGSDCDELDSQVRFRYNVAHSNKGSGAHITPSGSSTQLKCYGSSKFGAYKNTDMGLSTQYKSYTQHFKDMYFFDNAKGINLMSGGVDGNEILIKTEDISIWGETEALDCPEEGAPCWCKNKFGFMLSSANLGSKDAHPTSTSALPVYNIKSESAWNVKTDFVRTTFSSFGSKTACGANEYILHSHPSCLFGSLP